MARAAHKLVKTYTAALFVECPLCEADIPNAKGSLMWLPNEINPPTVECFDCGATLRLPSSLLQAEQEAGESSNG